MNIQRREMSLKGSLGFKRQSEKMTPPAIFRIFASVAVAISKIVHLKVNLFGV